MKHRFLFMAMGWIILTLFACQQQNNNEPLPYIGNHPDPTTKDYHKVRDFSFTNQDNQTITNATFKDKMYVVDFFFTSCPTICPKVKQQMLRIQEKFKGEDRVMLLSHSIDPKYDTVPKLKSYADKLEINSNKWHLVTGEFKDIQAISDDYMSIVIQDEEAPGGFDHSGRLILVDKDGHIRSFCTGTDPDEVTVFMNDIEKLLHEMDQSEVKG